MSHTKPYIRKKAVLIMYKVFLKYPESLRPAFPRLKEKLEDPDPGSCWCEGPQNGPTGTGVWGCLNSQGDLTGCRAAGMGVVSAVLGLLGLKDQTALVREAGSAVLGCILPSFPRTQWRGL